MSGKYNVYIDGKLQIIATSAAASDVTYDNSTSGLVATDVQDAVDETVGRVKILEGVGAYTTYTDPVLNAITQSDVDDYRGVVITLTAAGNNQTLPAPTTTTTYHEFTVINNDTSTDTITIIGASTIVLDAGKSIKSIWDGTAWIMSDSEGLIYDNGVDLLPQNSRGIDIPTGEFYKINSTQIGSDNILNNSSVTGTNVSDALNNLMTNEYPLQQVVWVSKAGNDTSGTVGRIDLPFLTIQAANDAISDATVSKKYLINAAPGIYTENVTLGANIYLAGVNTATTILTGSSGTLLTMPNGESGVREITFNLTNAADGSKCIDATSGGTHIIRNFAMNIESSTNGAVCQFLKANCDLLILGDFSMTANMTGSSAGANFKKYIEILGSTIASIARFSESITDNDADDVITAIYNGSTGRTKIQAESIAVDITNVAYSGFASAYTPLSTGSATQSVWVENINITGAGTGVGYGVYFASGSVGVAEIRNSTINVTGFTTNQAYYISATDTLYAIANIINCAQGSTILGTLRRLDVNKTSGAFDLDIDLNVSGNIASSKNIVNGYATTATAGGTTTLTVNSKGIQRFTGTLAQNVDMPVVTTLTKLGWAYDIINESTGILTVRSSGGNTITTVPAGTSAKITCILLTGTSEASWTSRVYATSSSIETLTNKTFDANGTGNSISNIDVADLANGTDGELITWDASGSPATVAVGTSGQVLTSNGAGASPTFQDQKAKEIDGSSSGALSVSDCSSTVINNYGQAAANVALTLPTAEAGLNFIAVVGTTQAGNTWKLTADTNDKIYLDGTAGSDNQSVIVTPAIGNFITMYTFQTGAATWDWIAITGQGTWSQGA